MNMNSKCCIFAPAESDTDTKSQTNEKDVLLKTKMVKNYKHKIKKASNIHDCSKIHNGHNIRINTETILFFW